MAILEIKNLRKSFGDTEVLKGIDLSLEKGEVLAIFGSSGGVTTTAEGRVTTQDGTVITGLYAAGEMSNRYFYNENYILAASLGLYSPMGRRAGAAAAQDALAK